MRDARLVPAHAGEPSHAVHDRVMAYIADPGTATFETLALAVFAHQYAYVAAYRRVCDRRGATPTTVTDWRAIPPVPARAFSQLELRCGAAARVFYSSGTSEGPAQRSRHAMPDLRLYHAAALHGLRTFLFPDVSDMRVLSLVPDAAACPESSLAQMCTWMREAYGSPGSAGFAHGDALDFTGLADCLRVAEGDGSPVCLATTTGALIRFLDRCRLAGWTFRLPHGSRVMDTGGLKGAPRVLSRNGLLHAVWTTLAIPGYFVVNEYGMSELSSQYYDNVVAYRWAGRYGHRAKVWPHFLRPRVLDPVTLEDASPGATGLLCHVDLANAGTAVAVLTEDLGRLTPDGLEVIGRASGAEARGCSLMLADFVTR